MHPIYPPASNIVFFSENQQNRYAENVYVLLQKFLDQHAVMSVLVYFKESVYRDTHTQSSIFIFSNDRLRNVKMRYLKECTSVDNTSACDTVLCADILFLLPTSGLSNL